MSTIESDEAYARQLQAQEMGIRNISPDIQTPLMVEHNRNPTVIHARLNEVTSARATVLIIVLFHLPQILATLFVLALHWDDNRVCDADHRSRWKLWSLLSAVRMALFTSLVVIMHVLHNWLEERPSQLLRITNFRNVTDALGLIWFVVGNMWLFGDDNTSCMTPQNSPIYQLCVALLVLNYIQICLPCIVAIMMIPIFCFCMPCLIRMLARLQDPRASKGATDEVISTLPLVSVTNETFSNVVTGSQDSTCPICLSEMAIGQEARLLNCKHIFHKSCVDEWLAVNASCPTCRQSIFAPTSVEHRTAAEEKAPEPLTRGVSGSGTSTLQSIFGGRGGGNNSPYASTSSRHVTPETTI